MMEQSVAHYIALKISDVYHQQHGLYQRLGMHRGVLRAKGLAVVTYDRALTHWSVTGDVAEAQRQASA